MSLTAEYLSSLRAGRSIHQLEHAWGLAWATIKGYLDGKVPNRESMIRALAAVPEIDETKLRAAIAADLAKAGAA
jgi:lambda repressor-like predicted transcriptional regulator